MRFKWHQKAEEGYEKLRTKRKVKIRNVSEQGWQKRRSVRMNRTFFRSFCHVY